MKAWLAVVVFLMSSATAVAGTIDATRANFDATSGSASQCLFTIQDMVKRGYGLSADVTSTQACFDLTIRMIKDFNYESVEAMAVLNGAHVKSFRCYNKSHCYIITP